MIDFGSLQRILAIEAGRGRQAHEEARDCGVGSERHILTGGGIMRIKKCLNERQAVKETFKSRKSRQFPWKVGIGEQKTAQKTRLTYRHNMSMSYNLTFDGWSKFPFAHSTSIWTAFFSFSSTRSDATGGVLEFNLNNIVLFFLVLKLNLNNLALTIPAKLGKPCSWKTNRDKLV